ncbi:tetraspanin family domain-containing protein [Ditylenchus destructor]|nr:tetraspanin family domain-containing protein [Ditylenchus destructor]
MLQALGLALIAALIWLRLDEHIEQSIRISFMDTNPNPYEMYEIKQGIRTVFTIGYWVVLGFGIALSIIGFIGMCGSIALSKTTNGFYITALILLLIFEIAVVVFVIFYRNQIQERIQRYLTVAFQYNLQDALTVSQRFNCCGDGSSNSYNYQCQQMGQPNCRDIIGERLNFLSLAADLKRYLPSMHKFVPIKLPDMADITGAFMSLSKMAGEFGATRIKEKSQTSVDSEHQHIHKQPEDEEWKNGNFASTENTYNAPNFFAITASPADRVAVLVNARSQRRCCLFPHYFSHLPSIISFRGHCDSSAASGFAVSCPEINWPDVALHFAFLETQYMRRSQTARDIEKECSAEGVSSLCSIPPLFTPVCPSLPAFIDPATRDLFLVVFQILVRLFIAPWNSAFSLVAVVENGIFRNAYSGLTYLDGDAPLLSLPLISIFLSYYTNH